MNLNSLIKHERKIIKLEKFSNNSGLFKFLSTQIYLISACVYKNNFIFLLSDFSIIIYDTIEEKKKHEINDYKNLNPLEIQILYYNNLQLKKDFLLILCETKLIVMNLNKLTNEYEFSFQEKSKNFEIQFFNNFYFIIIILKKKILILNIIKDSKSKCGFSLFLYNEIYTNSNDLILSKEIFLFNNFIGIETEFNIEFYILDFSNNKSKFEKFIFEKKKNFKNELLTNNEINLLTQNLFNSNNLLNKNLDFYKQIQLTYSNLSKYFYLTYVNKIFIINSNFLNEKNSNSNADFIFIDKIIKSSVIIFIKIIDPYIFLLIENKIYVYLVLDIDKCIDSIIIENGFNFMFRKNFNLLKNLNLLNYEKNFIQFNDEILINEINKGNVEINCLISTESAIFLFNNEQHLIDFYYLTNFSHQLNLIKKISVLYASKFLSCFKLNNFNSNDFDVFNNNLQNLNEKFFLEKNLEILFHEIKNNNFNNALIEINENNIDVIFLFILLKPKIKSKDLNLLLDYNLKFYLAKIIMIFTDDKNSNEKNEKNFNNEIKFIDYNIKNIDLNDINNFSLFIFTFIKKFVEIRNLFKNEISKEKNFFSFENFSSVTNSIKNINNLNEFNEMNEILYKNNLHYKQLKFCLFENILFILNFFAYKISKQKKYIFSLKEIIKNSYNILDPSIILLLDEENIQETKILFYYYKENYEKCINCIIEIYDNLNDFEEQNNNINENHNNFNNLIENLNNKNNFFKFNNNNNENFNFNNNNFNNNFNNDDYFFFVFLSSKNTKKNYLIKYLNLICKIRPKISEFEFNSYLKWALEKNSFETIDILISNKTISNKKIDENFIKILKNFGIDSIIYYLQNFSLLEGNENQSNEMINLYVIKIKLLNEENSNEKYYENIQKTRNELSNFLIKNTFYNISHAYDKISEIPFCEKEIGIVLIKQGNYENGIEKILNNYKINNNNNNINIDFEETLKLLLNIIENINEFDLVYLIIKKIKSLNFFENSTTHENLIIKILKKIENKSLLLSQLLNTEILDDLNTEKITEFYINCLNVVQGLGENYKIQSSFAKNKIYSELSQLYDLESNFYVVNNNSVCEYCKNKIYEKGKINENEIHRNNNNNNNNNDDEIICFDDKFYHQNCFIYLKENGLIEL